MSGQAMRSADVLLVDDHALFREGLAALLRTQPDMGRIAEAASVDEALALAPRRFTLIVLDIGLPGLNGLLGISLLREQFGDTPVLMLSADCSPASVENARRQGARGFVAKTESSRAIFAAMTRVLTGQSAFPDSPDSHGDPETLPVLTPRQTEVLALLCAGKPNKLIARELGLAEYTVREHVSNLLAILKVSSRAEAVSVALRHGLLR